MVVLSLVSNQIRDLYSTKYKNKKSSVLNRTLPNNLLFTTTTSAYGKSSVYERLKYQNRNLSEFMGFTAGAGTFIYQNDYIKN
jgi:glycosyltransferase involved in cell wall biosynthesis